jgi:carbon-monoxide dehydrogenase large subunit
MGQYSMGQAVLREEDPRLLRGEGYYAPDIEIPGMTHAAVVRSPHAHARIVRIDTSKALASPGVLAAFTGADMAKDKLGTIRCRQPMKRPDGKPMHQSGMFGLARERARLVGDPVAYVVAETYWQARDAAERVEVEYEALPSVTDSRDAVKPGAVALWDGCPDNVAFLYQAGDKAAVDAAFSRAKHAVRSEFRINRITNAALEARGCIGHWDPRSKRFTLYGGIAWGHTARRLFADEIFGIPETQFRVVAYDIGGSFGSKGNTSNENLVTLWASRKLGRPVRWMAERSETLASDDHARDNFVEAELALDESGKFLAMRVKSLVNLGAYLYADRQHGPGWTNLGGLAGTYTTPAIHVEARGIYTNTSTTATYRGAGRPEASYMIERMIDIAAREAKLDRVDLRRINAIPASAMPYKTGLTFTYDSGDFGKNLEDALELADYAGFEARRAESAKRGRLRGIGVTNTIERSSPPLPEAAEIRFDPTGTVSVVVGTKSQGQSHDIMYKILLSHLLGIDSDDVRLLEGDTDVSPFGIGTFGSRSAVSGGNAVNLAASKIVEKGKRIAAHLLEAAPTDISFERGRFVVAGTDRAVDLKKVAQTAFDPLKLPKGIEPGLYETGTYTPQPTFPNGCHVCEVEVDPETGGVEVLRYSVIDDVGAVINLLTLKGQIHGGIAQGLGQALMEDVHYDRESGQLLTGSFMDYAVPRAADLSAIEIHSNPCPTPTNPLGVKGAGEAGTVGGLPSVSNAVIHALSPLGVAHVDMPCTPERVWRAIKSARPTAPRTAGA